ncbi:MAG: hypothetical protein K2J08_10215 [Ruminococcus sp.]|nr:hypothetical protein [Ruminococcus sp.]
MTSAYSVTDDFYKYYGINKSEISANSAENTVNVTLSANGKTYSSTLTEK